jgi:hypothetical protein
VLSVFITICGGVISSITVVSFLGLGRLSCRCDSEFVMKWLPRSLDVRLPATIISDQTKQRSSRGTPKCTMFDAFVN